MRFVLFILSVAMLLGVVLVGGLFNYPNQKIKRSATNTVGIPISPSINAVQKTLQLSDFKFKTQTQCVPGGKSAVHLLLDNSTSMTAVNNGKKFKDLKASVIEFAKNLSDDDAIGVQIFNPPTPLIFPIDKYSVHKPTFENIINTLKSSGSTPTESRLRSAKDVMDLGFTRFPGLVRTLIMFTDGCPDGAPKKMPVADDIKNEGIRIIVIGIELGGAGKCPSPQYAYNLMRSIASPNDYYDAPDSNQLVGIVNTLKTSLNTCNP